MLPLPAGGWPRLLAVAALAALAGGRAAVARKGALRRAPLRSGGGPLRAGRSLLAPARVGARLERSGAARRDGRRMARGLGGGGRVRHPRHPRSSRAVDRGRLRRGGHRRGHGGAGDVVRQEAAVLQGARHVSTRTLLRVFWRSFFLQASWNPLGMQNVGFADAIAPALEELYPDPAQRVKAVARHLEFFNCHPYLAAAILGGAVRLGDHGAAGGARGAP